MVTNRRMFFLDHPNIYITDRESVELKINSFSLDRVQIVTDYDATITRADSDHSWSIFENPEIFSPGYSMEAKALFEQYHPIEIDPNIPLEEKLPIMQEWWKSCLGLFVKYWLHQSHIEEIIRKPHSMDFRHGFSEFLEESHKSDIPVVILSAGVSDVISSFLSSRGKYFPNIHIVSNQLKFWSNGICIEADSSQIIHSFNKSEQSLPPSVQAVVSHRHDTILLGDSLPDLDMIPVEQRDNALKIAFVSGKKLASISHFQKAFDIVIESANDTFDIPSHILRSIRKNQE